jgi:ATP-dependent RNA helicase DDX3X
MEIKIKGKYVPPHKRGLADTQTSKFEAFINKKDNETAESAWGRRDRRNGLLDSKVLIETEELFNEIKQETDEFEENFPIDVSENFPEMTGFEDCDVHATLLQNIKKLGYNKPTPIQKYSIPISLKRRDLMACAQTGSGKTAAYLFPIIAKMLNDLPPSSQGLARGAYPVSLILAPTRELSIQIYEEALKFSYRTGIKVAVVYGGADPKLQSKELDKGADIIVATPGRLIDFNNRGKITLSLVKYLIMDEADRMLDMGFEPQILMILEKTNKVRETGMFSATFPQSIQFLAASLMKEYVFLSVGRVGSTTDNITQYLYQVEENDKKEVLYDRLKDFECLILIFVETKKSADYICDYLKRRECPCTTIHGNRTQPERERALHDFKTGKISILVATDIAARGLDISNVGCVINYDMPNNIEDYVHRIGRTGRIGKKGTAISFVSEKNKPVIKDLYSLLCESNQEIPEWLEESYNSQVIKRSKGKKIYRNFN